MEGLLIGLDLCDDYSQLSIFSKDTMDAESFFLDEEKTKCLIPTVLCKKKGSDFWYIGEEAFKSALTGGGIMVDKLLKLTEKEGTSTMDGIRYRAEELLEIYINKLLLWVMEQNGGREIGQVVVTLPSLSPVVMDSVVRIMDRLGVGRSRLHMISHTESFVYYVLSQKKELWANEACLFDLTENGLHYYELSAMRGRSPQIIKAGHEFLEEGFSLDILETKSGKKLADNILTSCASRLLEKKVVSSVFLTGKGLENCDWADEFLKLLCRKRRVFAGQGVFAKGAAYVAFDSTMEKSAYPYICICEGRIPATVMMSAFYKGRERQLILASAGTNWYEAKASLEVITDGTDNLELTIKRMEPAGITRVSIPLQEIPKRPDRTTRLEIVIAFLREDYMLVKVKDLGFGEWFASSGKEIKQYISI